MSRKFLFALLFVIGIVLYLPSLGNGLFWDDDDFILKNTYIQDFRHVPKIFSENVIAGAGLLSDYWRPVLLLVFSLEWHMWGDWPTGFHFINVLFHAANAALLFWFLSLVLVRSNLGRAEAKWAAFFVALLFLIHPLQVEAVAYANSLGDSLSLFFMLFGLLFWHNFLNLLDVNGGLNFKNWRVWGWLLGALFFYFLALMSKETAIIFVGLLTLLYWYKKDFLFSFHGFLQNLKNFLFRIWAFLALAAAYLVLRATVLNFKNSFNLYGDHANIFTENLWVRLLTFCQVIFEYIKLIFWPKDLHMERTLDFAVSLWSWPVFLGALIIVALLVFSWQTRFKSPWIFLGVAWFFIALAPTSNIVIPINGLIYEHWLYVPLIGIGIALVGALKLLRIEYRRFGRALVFGCLVLALLLCVRTVTRILDWRDAITFYKQTLVYAPNSYRINNNLGMSLADAGRFSEAAPYYLKAISLDAANPVAFHNLGNLYEAAGNFKKAGEYYEKALDLDGNFLYAYPKLIKSLYQDKDYNRAMSVLDKYMEKIGRQPELVFLRQEIEQKQLQYYFGNLHKDGQLLK